MEKDRTEHELLSVVAYLYYYADMNQADIADRLFISRSTVSRLIKKARSSGVIELKINEPWQRDLVLEDRLKSVLGVSGARVLAGDSSISDDTALTMLGEMVSFYISCNMVSSNILGISWGNTFSRVVDSIVAGRKIPFTVVPIMGSLTWPRVNPESTEINYRFSKSYSAKFVPLDAPLYADDTDMFTNLHRKSDVTAALETARNADMVLTGVASIDDIIEENKMPKATLDKLKELGCIGRIGGHLYDISGCEIEGNFKDLHIGLSFSELKEIKNVMCVASHIEKAEAVYGAVKSGIVDSLFITETLAQKVLSIAADRRI